MTSREPSTWWTEHELGPQELEGIIAPLLDRLHAALDSGRMPHSLLLGGPERLGRERTAVELAAMLTCPAGGVAGCSCSSCRRVRSGVHPDVTLVRPQGTKGQIVIDQVRAVVEAAPGKPFEGRSRVWIFDGVEASRFGLEAANAFLKTLEEPPDHVRFVLLAANCEAVLPTIRSRCQRLALPGALAMAAKDGSTPMELLPAAVAGTEVSVLVSGMQQAIRAALEGETVELLRMSKRLDPEPAGFQIAVLAALESAVDIGSSVADGCLQLAVNLLEAEKRQRALNLNRGRQILSCLLGWYAAGPATLSISSLRRDPPPA